MHIIAETTLKQAYTEQYPDAQSSIEGWIKFVRAQKWNSPADVMAKPIFSPSLVKNFVIFNISGNSYRLITYIDYEKKKVFIRDFLTHAEYDASKWRQDEWFNG